VVQVGSLNVAKETEMEAEASRGRVRRRTRLTGRGGLRLLQGGMLRDREGCISCG
jgi:hypothetical protein